MRHKISKEKKMTKKTVAVVVLLLLVCGGAFAGPFAPLGWGFVAGGATGVIVGYALDYHELDVGSYILLGGGVLIVLLDLAFSDNSSMAQAKSNPILKRVSFGVAPNAAHIGVRFSL
jgi:hypothetical protein